MTSGVVVPPMGSAMSRQMSVRGRTSSGVDGGSSRMFPRMQSTTSLGVGAAPVIGVDGGGPTGGGTPLVTGSMIGHVDLGIPRVTDRSMSPTHAEKVAMAKATIGTTKRKFRRAVRKVILLHRMNGPDVDPSKFTFPHAGAAGAPVVGDPSGLGPLGKLGGTKNISAGGASGEDSTGAGDEQVESSVDAYVKTITNIYRYTTQRQDAIDPLPPAMFNPDSPRRLLWDVMLLGLVLHDGLVVPYRLAFDDPATGVAVVFDDVAQTLFLLDVCLNFMTTYKNQGVLVTDRVAAAVMYARTWFILDACASFPIDWITGGEGGGLNRLLKLVRLAKLFRILRLLKLFPKIFSLLEGSISFNPSLIRFLRSFAILLLAWHWIGCLYWNVSLEEYGGLVPCEHDPSLECFKDECITTYCASWGERYASNPNPDRWVPHPEWAQASKTSQYLFSLFWAVQATTGIGNDVEPKTHMEVAFSTSIVALGLILMAVIIGSAASALSNMDASSVKRRQRVDHINGYLKAHKIPSHFRKVLHTYFEHAATNPTSPDALLMDLPPTLRFRLVLLLHQSHIQAVPVFKDLSAPHFVRLVQKLIPVTFVPGEYIVQEGDLGDHMHIVKRGKVDLVKEPNIVIRTLKPGHFFGEDALLERHATRMCSARAVDFVDVLALGRPDFEAVASADPLFKRHIAAEVALRNAAIRQVDRARTLVSNAMTENDLQFDHAALDEHDDTDFIAEELAESHTESQSGRVKHGGFMDRMTDKLRQTIPRLGDTGRRRERRAARMARKARVPKPRGSTASRSSVVEREGSGLRSAGGVSLGPHQSVLRRGRHSSDASAGGAAAGEYEGDPSGASVNGAAPHPHARQGTDSSTALGATDASMPPDRSTPDGTTVTIKVDEASEAVAVGTRVPQRLSPRSRQNAAAGRPPMSARGASSVQHAGALATHATAGATSVHGPGLLDKLGDSLRGMSSAIAQAASRATPGGRRPSVKPHNSAGDRRADGAPGPLSRPGSSRDLMPMMARWTDEDAEVVRVLEHERRRSISHARPAVGAGAGGRAGDGATDRKVAPVGGAATRGPLRPYHSGFAGSDSHSGSLRSDNDGGADGGDDDDTSPRTANSGRSGMGDGADRDELLRRMSADGALMHALAAATSPLGHPRSGTGAAAAARRAVEDRAGPRSMRRPPSDHRRGTGGAVMPGTGGLSSPQSSPKQAAASATASLLSESLGGSNASELMQHAVSEAAEASAALIDGVAQRITPRGGGHNIAQLSPSGGMQHRSAFGESFGDMATVEDFERMYNMYRRASVDGTIEVGALGSGSAHVVPTEAHSPRNGRRDGDGDGDGDGDSGGGAAGLVVGAGVEGEAGAGPRSPSVDELAAEVEGRGPLSGAGGGRGSGATQVKRRSYSDHPPPAITMPPDA